MTTITKKESVRSGNVTSLPSWMQQMLADDIERCVRAEDVKNSQPHCEDNDQLRRSHQTSKD
jgi:hypothetical protein